MEKVKPFDKSKIPDVTINPELEKYRDQILFPESLARANEMLKKCKITDIESLRERLKKLTQR